MFLSAPGNELGFTPAYGAAEIGHPQCLIALSELGVDLSAPCNNEGDTPAYLIADRYDIDIIVSGL